MNDAHFHLVVNHLPIIIPGIGLLVMAGGFISRSAIVKRTAYFIFILGALCTITALGSGEGAEEVVEHIPGIEHKLIHIHEEMAETFGLLSYILGGLSLIGLWANFKHKSFATIVAIITILFSTVVLYFGAQTGTTGGEISHTEIREGAVTPAAGDHDEDEEEEHHDEPPHHEDND